MSKPLDPLALKVGAAYRRGLAAHVEAGRLLAEKKANLKHGQWEKWIAANKAALGFSDPSTAWRLIKLARKHPNLAPAQDSPDDEAITRQLWGHDKRTPSWSPWPLFRGAGSGEWYTPPKFVALVKRVFGGKIGLDPASCEEANSRWLRARTFYTKEQNGLTQPWRGKVYLNPPFQTEFMGPFVNKLVTERENGNVSEAIMLCSLWPEKKWFWPILDHAALLCLPRDYVSYIPPGKDKPTGHPKLASVFSYWGDKPDRFADVFGEVGTIMTVYRRHRIVDPPRSTRASRSSSLSGVAK